MYGTVGRFKLKPGHYEDFRSLMEEFRRDRAPNVSAFVGSYTYRLDSDPDTLILAVAFKDKDAYFANANDPEQDKWFGRMAEHFAAEPEWNDGEIVWTE